jgi:hypothetical protein
MKKGMWIAASILGIMYLGVLYSSPDSPGVGARALATSGPEHPGTQDLSPKWEYATQSDSVGSGLVSIAAIESLSPISFGFPYGGAQRGTLKIQAHPRWGRSAALSIIKGQFICNDPCYTTVQFDDGRVWQYETVLPADNSTTIVFIRDHADFIRELRKARRVRMEALFFQEGTRTFEFKVAGLNWK